MQDMLKVVFLKNGMMSKHIQIEANMSLAGANADVRIPMTVAQQKQALADLYYAVVNGAQPKMLKLLKWLNN